MFAILHLIYFLLSPVPSSMASATETVYIAAELSHFFISFPLMWLSLQMLHPIIGPFIFIALGFLYPVVEPGFGSM